MLSRRECRQEMLGFLLCVILYVRRAFDDDDDDDYHHHFIMLKTMNSVIAEQFVAMYMHKMLFKFMTLKRYYIWSSRRMLFISRISVC